MIGGQMTSTRNITLAIPKDILKKAKLLAVEKNTSLSALLAHTLEELIAQEEGFLEARRSSLELLEKGFDLGTNDQVRWTREDLHER
jgi:hypothetical protein